MKLLAVMPSCCLRLLGVEGTYGTGNLHFGGGTHAICMLFGVVVIQEPQIPHTIYMGCHFSRGPLLAQG